MIYLILSILCSASLALVLRFAGDSGGNRYGVLLGNYACCVLISLLMMPDRGIVLRASGATIACGVLTGILFVSGLTCMQESIRRNGATLTAAFAKLGLVVSLLASLVFFNEKPKPFQFAGMALVLAAVWLISGSGRSGENAQEEPDRVSLPILLLTLLVSGSGDTMTKVFEFVGDMAEDTAYFFFVFFTALVICLVLTVIEGRRSGKKLLLRDLSCGTAAGVPNYYCSFFLLKALLSIPAFLTYSMFSTCTILVVMAMSALLFREKPAGRQLAGIAVILAALVLLNV